MIDNWEGLIFPLKRREINGGIMELTSFRELKEYEREFLDKAGESIAVALKTQLADKV